MASGWGRASICRDAERFEPRILGLRANSARSRLLTCFDWCLILARKREEEFGH